MQVIHAAARMTQARVYMTRETRDMSLRGRNLTGGREKFPNPAIYVHLRKHK
jgi:hypothetical protein